MSGPAGGGRQVTSSVAPLPLSSMPLLQISFVGGAVSFVGGAASFIVTPLSSFAASTKINGNTYIKETSPKNKNIESLTLVFINKMSSSFI